MGRHLVIQLARAGDVLQTTPLLRRLRQVHPLGTIAVLVDSSVAPIARRCPEVDLVLEIDTRAILRDIGPVDAMHHAVEAAAHHCAFLSREQFDSVHTLNYSMLAVLLGCMVPCNVRRGYWMAPGGGRIMAEPWLTMVQTLVQEGSVTPFNLVDVFCGLCPVAPGTPSAISYRVSDRDRESAERLCGTVAPGQRPVALQLGTRHPRRTWPVERFVEVGTRLLRHGGGELWVLGDTSERPLADAFLRLLHARADDGAGARVRDFVGSTVITDLAPLLQNAELLITGDTGTMHIAAAIGCRVLALFTGPARWACTGPWGNGHCILTSRVPCYPCSEDDTRECDRQCQCAITADMVVELARCIITNAPLPAPRDTVDLLRSESDQWGIVYRNMGSRGCLEFQNRCYRRMGFALLRPGACAAGQGPAERGGIGTHLIEAARAAGCGLLHLAVRDPFALWRARQDARYRFWHPWIDVHAALRRAAAEPAGAAAATAMWSEGLRAGLDFLEEHLGEPAEWTCESAAV